MPDLNCVTEAEQVGVPVRVYPLPLESVVQPLSLSNLYHAMGFHIVLEAVNRAGYPEAIASWTPFCHTSKKPGLAVVVMVPAVTLTRFDFDVSPFRTKKAPSGTDTEVLVVSVASSDDPQ
jgi:hypothetical protein